MKAFLLTVFLILSLSLPLLVAFENRKTGMLLSMAFGVFLYLLSTSIANFISLAIGLSDLSSGEDRLTYVVIISISLVISTGLFRMIKQAYADKKSANLIYSGFALINTFIYNMNSYSFLVFISMNNSLDKLQNYYSLETAKQLLNHYNEITYSSILLLIIEMSLTFFILKSLLISVCKKDSSAFDYLFFLIGAFMLYYSQYCIENSVITFIVYLVLLLVNYSQFFAKKGKY